MEIRLPKLGFSMTEGILVEWFVADGARVEKGELLYALEAEKAVEEIEAPESGTVRIHVQPGDEPLAIGTLLAEIT